MREPFRVPVLGNVQDYKTYTVAAPRATHWRAATCAEVDCDAWRNGWVTRVPADSPQARYIVERSGRAWRETTGMADIAAGLREFMFPAGERCFGQHQLPIGREPLYVVRDGDYRGNPTGRRMVHANAQDWVDDFGEHQQRLAETQERG